MNKLILFLLFFVTISFGKGIKPKHSKKENSTGTNTTEPPYGINSSEPYPYWNESS